MPWTSATMIGVAVPGAFTVLGLALGLVLRRVLRVRAAGRAADTTRLTDVIAGAVGRPVVLWGGLLGLYAGTEVATLPPNVAPLAQRTLLVLTILSVSWALAQLTGVLVAHAASRVAGRLPSATLLVNFARIGVLGTGVLIILQTLGVSIAPLLTALGVGGLAVGLALQDTLANFFAGLHILTSHQVRQGDYVRLTSGEEGYVQDVTWRYTTIRQLPNNLTVVPNAKLASTILTNFYLPDRELAVLVDVGVSYDSDLQTVEDVTMAVGREVMREVPGGVPEFAPFIRYNAFAESSITFTVILRGKEVVDQYLIRHEFIKRLHARYRAEGIEIPFPIRTLHVRGGGTVVGPGGVA